MKKPIRFIIVFAVAIVVIAGVNRAVQWFLESGKAVAVEKTQTPAPTNPSPKKN